MRPILVAEAQAFDRFAQEKLGIPSVILMENAGRHVAQEAINMLRTNPAARSSPLVAIICGVGNNGGDGLVAARHLLNAGVKVEVVIVGKLSKIKTDPKTNLNILKKMGIGVKRAAEGLRSVKRADIIIDAIFGIGLTSEVRQPYASIINSINNSKKPVLSVDVPSGLEADTGKILGVAVKAKKTITFVAPKKGFYKADGPKCCGKVLVRDIGIV